MASRILGRGKYLFQFTRDMLDVKAGQKMRLDDWNAVKSYIDRGDAVLIKVTD